MLILAFDSGNQIVFRLRRATIFRETQRMVDPKGSSSWLKSLYISDVFGWKDYGEYGAVAAIVIGILVPVLFSVLFLGKKRGKVRGVPVEVGGEAGYAVRNARKTELVEVPWKGAPTMAHLFEQSCNKYSHNRFLGTRKLIGKEFVTASDGRRFEKLHLGDYEWETYGEVFARVSNFASGLLKLGHDIDSRVAIFSDTCAEWLIALQVNLLHQLDFLESFHYPFVLLVLHSRILMKFLLKLQGCFRLNITVVTIYASLGEDALIHSLNEVGNYYLLHNFRDCIVR